MNEIAKFLGDRSGTVMAPAASVVPMLIANAGEQAAWRYIDFFTANIRNPNTRRAYARACNRFFAWCGERGRSLGTIRPYDVSLYIETQQQTHSAPDVKQQLAELGESERPATADAEGLRHFLEAEVMSWIEARKTELANRPQVRSRRPARRSTPTSWSGSAATRSTWTASSSAC